MAALERWGDTAFVRTDVHLRDLSVLVLVGAGTAVAAAILPARQVARLDVVAALTGRRATALPTSRVPVTGIVVALAGGALAWAGAEKHMAVPLVLGIATAEVGLVMASGGVVAAVARLARRLPLAPRLALRDAVRHRGRTAPAVAAVMAAVAGTTAVTLYVTAQQGAERAGYRPSGAIGTVTVLLTSAFDDDRLPASAVRENARITTGVLERHMAGTSLVPLRALDGRDLRFVPPPAQRCPLDGDPGTNTVDLAQTYEELAEPSTDARCRQLDGDLVEPRMGPLVDDGTAAAVLTGVDDPAVRAALRSGRVVVPDARWLWPDGTVHVVVTAVGAVTGAAPAERTVVVPGAVATTVPRLAAAVVPEAALRPLGARAYQAGLVGRTATMPTVEQERLAADALEALGAGLMVERGYRGDYGPGLLALIVASLLITLVGTFTAVGLAATEGRPDVATLAAVGASPGLRRRLAAAQAAVVAGLGAVLGVGSGMLAGAALVRLQQPSLQALAAANEDWTFTVPWIQVAAVGIGVPALTVVAAFALTRSRLPLQRRIAG